MIFSLGVLALSLDSPALHAAGHDEFLENYAAKANELERAYSHVRILATRVTKRKKGGSQTAELEELRDGVRVLEKETMLHAFDAEQAGGVMVAGGDKDKYFVLRKPSGGERFAIATFGPNPELSAKMGAAKPLLCAPYCVYNLRLQDFLKSPSITIVSVGSTSVSGRDAVEVHADDREPSGLGRFRLVFDRKTGGLMEMTESRGDGTPQRGLLQIRVSYNFDDIPKIKSMETWGEVPVGVKINDETYTVSSLEFGPIPRDRFSVAAFNLEEPALRAVAPAIPGSSC